jgi:hypothetical protein
MRNEHKPIHTWQGWLDEFLRNASAAGWRDYMALLENEDIQPWQWAAMYPMLLERDLTAALLLVCLQVLSDEAEAALATIANQALAVRFGKPPSNMKRSLKELYREAAKKMLRDLTTNVDFFQSVFMRYLRDEYDTTNDANLVLREAQALLAMNQRTRALDLAGRAGAAALCGQSIWAGWADEGTPEFRSWALALTTMLEGFAPVLPLAEIAAERARAADRAHALSPDRPRELTENDEPELPAYLDPRTVSPEKFIEQWTSILDREEPLSDMEIVAMGDHYEELADSALTVLSAPASELPPDVRDGVMSVAATLIGMLRYGDELAITCLLDIVGDESYGGDTVNNAIWALQQLGAKALKPCFDFARYTSRDAVRDDVLEVVGMVGRGDAVVFAYLTQQFQETTWDNQKVRFAYPLSLLHDARAVPLIVEALRDPLVSDDDAWELLDALEELDVEFTTDEARHAIDVTDYGVIENVLPTDWMPRAEREAEWVEEVQKMEDMLDAEESDAEVVFDERGVACCPDCGVEMQWLNGRWVHPSPTARYDLPSASRLTPPPPMKPMRIEQKVGRNDPCPCGSGKKYKQCHGKSLAVN